jgi:phosphoglycolate phosphatase
MRLQIQSIVFDFDYTLADSSKGAVDCINYSLSIMGLPPAEDDRACSTIGLSLADTFVALTQDNDSARASRFSRLFVERADQTMVDLTSLFEWAPAAIRALKGEGFSLGIVSTKYRRRIHAILSREALLDPFEVIVGGEDVAQHKPHPEGVFKALEAMRAEPSKSIYVGDGVVDARLAQSAQMPFVAVLSGVTRREAFDPFPVVEIIDNVTDLPRVLAGRGSPGELI